MLAAEVDIHLGAQEILILGLVGALLLAGIIALAMAFAGKKRKED